MSGATYSVYLASPSTGTRFLTIKEYTSLTYVRAVNRVGSLTQSFPMAAVPWASLPRDSRILVYRSVNGGPEYLDTETVWLIRRRDRRLDAQGQRSIEIQARSINDILRRRLVAYDAAPQAAKEMPADDMMKAIVRENLGALADDTARNLGAYLTVAPDLSQAPVTGRTFPWQRVQDVLSGIANDSAQKGTPLFFDVVAVTETQFEFRTYIGQRGIDRRAGSSGGGGLVLSPDNGTLVDVTLTEDSGDEITYAYGAGSGSEDARITQVASDPIRVGVSPFNRTETFTSGNAITTTDVQALADSAVAAGIPRIIMRGRAQDTDATRYGRDWRWGDAMTASVDEYKMDVRADTVKVTVANNKDTVETWLGVS